MHGDFSRLTFDSAKQYSRVLMQQGRVQIDADWNEQASLLLEQIRTLARSLIGPVGGVGAAFQVTPNDDRSDLVIAPGIYFVNGILGVSDGTLRVPRPSTNPAEKRPDGDYLVYLSVFERHVTFVQDDDLRDKALGAGVDTASRTKVLVMLSVLAVPGLAATAGGARDEAVQKALVGVAAPDDGRPQMSALIDEVAASPHEICTVPPFAHYRGPGNQLYRVEIHQPAGPGTKAAFKWSRENGSVVFPVTGASDGRTLSIERFGRSGPIALAKDDWVELEDDALVAAKTVRDLARVVSVQADRVTLDTPAPPDFGKDARTHPLLRRWDRGTARAGAATARGVTLIEEEKKPYPLELGVSVAFETLGHPFRRGDYWLVPARTATGNIDWPKGVYRPARRAEWGVAPLAILTMKDGKVDGAVADLRSTIAPLAKPVGP